MNPPLRIIRSRRRTAAIQITPEGEILIRCPLGTSDARARQLAADHAGWIAAKLNALSHQSAVSPFSEDELQRLCEKARQMLPDRVRFWAARIGVSYGRITVRRQHTLWGSCSSRGNLSFNGLLAAVPPEVCDYVVVHELCHRLQMNHSPAFWAEVARAMPDYESRRRWLRENGAALIRRLPAAH